MCGCIQGKRIVCSASKVTTCSSIYSMLCKQGDNIFMSKPNMPLIIYQSCHAIVKQDDSHYMIDLAPVLFENMTVTFMYITKCSYCIPSFSNKKISHVEKDEISVTFSSTIPVDTFSFARP